MRILLTGVTGYIGRRLLPVLLDDGHTVICCVRDRQRFNTEDYPQERLQVTECDFLQPDTLQVIPSDIDAAYYLIHSMTGSNSDFDDLEANCARNFQRRMEDTAVQQVVYLSGIVNEDQLSRHLQSRKQVEEILARGSYHLTTLRAGIIVGSGSASFEIIRDLVEKLPVMVAPKWVHTRSQPIAIRNVIEFLQGVLLQSFTYDRSFDIGGPEILTYKQMLLQLAEVRQLQRFILTVPVMTPRLSSYWLYFVTSTSYQLAVHLVNSMKVEVVCEPNDLHKRLQIELLSYREALLLAFDKIAQEEVLSSWTDALSGHELEGGVQKLLKVPTYGCLKDERHILVKDQELALDRIWSIGGKNGWYYGNWLWEIRGFLDKLVGGVGLRRGRKNPHTLEAGESLDFWRVLYASREDKRLLLYAEMKLPGEAWLEWKIRDDKLFQIATFRPRGVWGRLYWLLVLPFHNFIFDGMLQAMVKPDAGSPENQTEVS